MKKRHPAIIIIPAAAVTAGILIFNAVSFSVINNSLYDSAAKNAELIEYHPYDDFDAMPPLLPLSGELREIEWKNADSLIIGDEKYPLVFKVSDLSDKFTLIELWTGEKIIDSDGYVSDSYSITYMGREFGYFSAIRKEDDLKENAEFSILTTITDQTTIPFALSFCGIPANGEISEIIKYFPSDDPTYTDMGIYGGVVNDDSGGEYFVRIRVSESLLTLSVTSLKVNPGAYDNYIENINGNQSERGD